MQFPTCFQIGHQEVHYSIPKQTSWFQTKQFNCPCMIELSSNENIFLSILTQKNQICFFLKSRLCKKYQMLFSCWYFCISVSKYFFLTDAFYSLGQVWSKLSIFLLVNLLEVWRRIHLLAILLGVLDPCLCTNVCWSLVHQLTRAELSGVMTSPTHHIYPSPFTLQSYRISWCLTLKKPFLSSVVFKR